jgi:hypothetical protein
MHNQEHNCFVDRQQSRKQNRGAEHKMPDPSRPASLCVFGTHNGPFSTSLQKSQLLVPISSGFVIQSYGMVLA